MITADTGAITSMKGAIALNNDHLARFPGNIQVFQPALDHLKWLFSGLSAF